MYAFLTLVSTVISIYVWLLIAQAVLSWLVAFGIVNRYNRVVATVGDFLWRITEPLLRPIRRVIPDQQSLRDRRIPRKMARRVRFSGRNLPFLQRLRHVRCRVR